MPTALTNSKACAGKPNLSFCIFGSDFLKKFLEDESKIQALQVKKKFLSIIIPPTLP